MGEVGPQSRDNIDFEGDSLVCLCVLDSSPWWVLIGAILSTPSGFLCFAFGVGSSRLVISSVASRWRWLPMGIVCEIEYLRELLPWARDTFSNSMSKSLPLVAMSSFLRGT